MSDVREILECWHNSGGFSSCDESECFEKVYTLAAAYASECVFMAKIDQWCASTWPELVDPQLSIVLGREPCALRGLDDGQLETIRKLAKIGHAYICANRMRITETKDD